MKRKIIKQGHNTLTITLPVEWSRRFNLESGKEVDIEERENGLFISTEKTIKDKTTEIDITNMDIPTIWKYFMAVYREGFTEVIVRFDTNSNLDSPYKFYSQHKLDLKYNKQREKISSLEALQGFSDRFIGFEIVEHGKNHVIIREMGESTSKEFDNSLRRIFLLLQGMAEDTLESLKTGNQQLVAHMHDVDINLDKFHDYCIRILNKSGNKDHKKTNILFTTLYILELIGDEFKRISHHILFDFKQKTNFKSICSLAEITKQLLDTFYDLFYKFDKGKIEHMSQVDRELYTTVGNIYKKSSEEEKEIYHHLRVIGRYINALVELRIEMEF